MSPYPSHCHPSATATQHMLSHAGWTETEGVKTSLPSFYSSFKNKLRTLEQGADTTVYLCLEVCGCRGGRWLAERAGEGWFRGSIVGQQGG